MTKILVPRQSDVTLSMVVKGIDLTLAKGIGVLCKHAAVTGNDAFEKWSREAGAGWGDLSVTYDGADTTLEFTFFTSKTVNAKLGELTGQLWVKWEDGTMPDGFFDGISEPFYLATLIDSIPNGLTLPTAP